MSINLHLLTVEVLLFFVVRVDAQCGPGFEGPNSGACVACPAGKFKNTTGNNCSTCPENTYSLSGASLCTACPAGFTSPNGSTVLLDCCEPNSIYVKNLHKLLSSTTKTLLNTKCFGVKVSSIPGLSSFGSAANPGISPPAYNSSGDLYNRQPFLRFSKSSSVSNLNRLSMSFTITPNNGIVIVTVVRFMESIGGVFWSVDDASKVFGLHLTSTMNLCAQARDGHWGSYAFCTAPVPVNVWLKVSYTYNRYRAPKQILRVEYLSTTGSTIVLSATGDLHVWRDPGNTPCVGPTHILGYSTNPSCSTTPLPCDRPNFDLTGLYIMEGFVSDADIALFFEAIAVGFQFLFDRIEIDNCVCSPGFGGNDRSKCKSCVAGKYKHEIRTGSCLDCGSGTYSTAVQATNVDTCTACPQGYGDSCIGCTVLANCSCNVASYGPNLGPCLACPSNSGASCRGCTDLTGCTCNPGFTGPNGGPCTACHAGSYKIASGNASCTNCTAGLYSTTLNATAAATCLACPVNMNSPIMSAVITNCTCNLGFTGPNGGPCTACAITTYKDKTGNATCAACPTASTSPAASIAIAACTCNLGFTGPNGGPCRACSGGTYKTAIGSAVCTNCLANQYSVNLAATAAATCLACPVNMNSPVMSQSIENCSCNIGFTGRNGGPCTACTAGKFKSVTGPANCTSCPQNTGASCVGCIAPTGCTCNAGLYGPNGGPCLQCPSNSGASCSGCTIVSGCTCNLGFTGPNGGNCTACRAGTYKTVTGTAVCTNCTAGLYSTTLNATAAATCLVCPLNANSPVRSPEIVSCTCNMGYTGPDGTNCTSCVAGMYKNTTGSMPCTACPAGGNASVLGALSIRDCCGLNSVATCPTLNWARSCGASGNQACVATSQSIYQNNVAAYGPANLVDGNEGSIFISLMTNPGTQWWQVDFSREVGINTVIVYNSGTPTWLSNFNLQLSNDGTTFINCATAQVGSTTGPLISMHICDGSARYLRLFANLPVNSYLYLREIQVFGNCSTAKALQCQCNAGYTGPNLGASRGNCTTCATGTYKNTTGSTPCLACPLNRTSLVASQSIASCFTSCPVGQTGTPCVLCATGTYKETTGIQQCTACPTGYISPEGSTSSAACVDCAAGFTGPSGGPCAACVAGKYKDATGSAACIDCGIGTYSSTLAATAAAACVACPNNTFSGVIGISNVLACQSCQPNAVSVAGSVSQEYCYCKAGYAHVETEFRCNACTPGTYNSHLARKACSNCTIGMYSVHYNATGPETCQACPTGQWSPEGSANCNLCPLYSKTLGTSGSVSDCVCDAGYTGKAGSTCTPCSVGKYKDVTGSAACTDCGSGTYSTTNAVTSAAGCLTCPTNSGASCTGCSAAAGCTCNIGYTGPDGGVCSACAAGTYKDITGSVACTDCGAGTYSTTKAAAVATACLACPVGTNSPAVSTSSAACINSACNAGYTGTDGICSTCIAGTYKVGMGSAACTSCVTGTYSTTPAATAETACLSCPVNSNSPSQSSTVTACTCNAGYSGPNGGVCDPCASGTYKDTVGPATCMSCPSFFGDLCMSCVSTAMCVCTVYTGQTCTECVSGSAPASLNSDDCVCGPGQYDESQ